MAVSGLEQRMTPLVISCPIWAPWGPGLIAPCPLEDEASDDEHDLPRQKPQMRRSLTWGSFPTFAQAKRYSLPLELDLFDEPNTPLTAMSDPICGSRRSRQRRRRDNDAFSKPADVLLVPAPVLLGSRGKPKEESKGIPTKPQEDVVAGEMCKESGAITTLMIRNLPYSMGQQPLLQAIDDAGYAGLFDYLYLPHKFREHKNLGFAFVNFVNSDAALKFLTEWHHTHRFQGGGLRKPLNISVAEVQGRTANEQAAKSQKMGRVKNGFFKPLLLDKCLEGCKTLSDVARC